ncbi:MAG: 16S rRNA (uracil(1498)-N(3))-methyltransferase [Anaerolineae bacterium]|nr:16S rRNA (uracil(1498)-N(3))-methyltransferase [Anaerolineae bacterium]
MQRFFVPPTAIQNDRVTLTGPVVHQLTHVLRLSPGQRIVVLDDSGWEYTVELQRLGRGQAEGQIVERWEAQGEPRTRLTLYQAVLKGERFAWVLQKGTELGIAAFVPLLCARNVVRDPAAVRQKLPRWQAIVREAAEQARRGRLPRLAAPLPFAEACAQAQAAGGLSLLAWEEETATSLKATLRAGLSNLQLPTSNIQLFIGPEGGFTPDEVALAQAQGIRPVSLGRRILRAETAGLVAAAIIFYELDDLS